MKLKLPAEVSSLQDLKAAIMELRGYGRQASHTEIKKRVHAKAKHSQPAVELSAATSALLREWSKTEPLTASSITHLIEQLEDYAADAKTVTITLAAPATSGLKKKLVAWCRETIGHDVLVSFQFNSNLLGGIVVRYGSRIFDWSFRRQILENRLKFPEVLRRV